MLQQPTSEMSRKLIGSNRFHFMVRSFDPDGKKRTVAVLLFFVFFPSFSLILCSFFSFFSSSLFFSSFVVIRIRKTIPAAEVGQRVPIHP